MDQPRDPQTLVDFLTTEHSRNYIKMMLEIWESNRIELSREDWRLFVKYLKKMREAGMQSNEAILYEKMIEEFLDDAFK